MHRLSYHSSALAAGPAVLDAVYAEAAAFNASAGITGALLYLDGRWAQILEGDHAAVTGLYDRITRDARHDHVTFDYLIETEGRLFRLVDGPHQRRRQGRHAARAHTGGGHCR